MEADEAETICGSTAAEEETNRQSKGKERGPSLNSLALARKATTPADIFSMDINDWHPVVYEGVLLENNTQKFWVDEILHKNCFLVLPKACDIARGDEESCWSWIIKEVKCIVDIPVPKSNKLSWLLIQGRLGTRALSPNTTYAVAFVVQLTETVYGGEISEVKLELDLPDGTKRIGTESLQGMLAYEWINLHAGEFMVGPETVGTIYFALHGELNLEVGLILKGILIHPKD